MKKNTFDMTKVHLKTDDQLNIKETIRQHENSDFKRAAEEYERRARQRIYGEYNDDIDIKGRAERMAGDVGRRARDAENRAKRSAEAMKRRVGAGKGRGKRKAAPRSYANASKEYGQYGISEYDDFPKYDQPPRGRSKQKGGRKKRRLNPVKAARNIIVLLAVAFVAFCLFFFGLTSHLDKVPTKKDDFAISDQAASDLKGYRNIAILGLDARADESYDGSRTDAIIILRIKKSNGNIKMISVMRDSYVRMMDSENKSILDKLTHAHHYGGGVDTCAALNRNLDLNIKEFMIFNWSAVADMVDTLGGIEVDVKANEIHDLNKWGPETAQNVGSKWHPITKTGKQIIDGAQATTYCRIRKSSGGDTSRGNRYKKVMSATMKKAMKSPGKMTTLARDVFPKIRTNMNKFQLLSAVLRAPGYDIDDSLSWPNNFYGGLLSNGVWYAVPKTLSSNVSWLHKKAFKQEGYTPSSVCEEISKEIIFYTGIQ